MPVLTAPAPAERSQQDRHRRHTTLTAWARHLLVQVRRWLPDRALVVVADRTAACLAVLAGCQRLARPITVSTRLRLDGALTAPAPPRRPGQVGRPRLQEGQRRPTLATCRDEPTPRWMTTTIAPWDGAGERQIEIASAPAGWSHAGRPPVPIRWVLIRDRRGRCAPQALRSTDLERDPAQIVAWCIRRWPVAVTRQDGRRHLGVQTQRQWSALALRRTTPALLGRFSRVTRVAHARVRHGGGPIRQAAWYLKQPASFTDALALVRADRWAQLPVCRSVRDADSVTVPRVIVERLTDTLCDAA